MGKQKSTYVNACLIACQLSQMFAIVCVSQRDRRETKCTRIRNKKKTTIGVALPNAIDNIHVK